MKSLTRQFGATALALADASGLEQTCLALEQGRLTRRSTAVVREVVANGNVSIEQCLRVLLQAWNDVGDNLSGETLALLLRASVGAVEEFRKVVPTTQVVWTGPSVDGSYLRSTREVVRDIIRGATSELLVVGYWLAARDDGEGIIADVIEMLATAVRRKVSVTVVFDERVRADGRDNLQILVSIWPANSSLPEILTWKLPSTDRHVKLHAKVLVADRNDALITSANLTSYAMDRNMEMGARIIGRPAADIAGHFHLLADKGVLIPYGNG